MPLLECTPSGIHCPKAGVSIDPLQPVEKALITHAHADHARPGHGAYCCHPDTAPFLRHRLGDDLSIGIASYGECFSIHGVTFSFHPAGHMPGSAQVRVEHKGEVWVVTGDHKPEADGLSEPFEPVSCHTLVTECTFGLPVYRFPDPSSQLDAIRDRWKACWDEQRSMVLFAYSLRKAQRLLYGIGADIGPIYAQGSLAKAVRLYRSLGHSLPPIHPVSSETSKKELQGALVMAPPSALGSRWLKRFSRPFLAMASGWMRVRGKRRQRAIDQGFVLSDHADWNGLNSAVEAASPERVITSHGFNEAFARWLREWGYEAWAERDLFESEEA